LSPRATFRFRLYIAGDADNASQAIADRHEIEVVDVFREPKRALADGVFMTPTLVKLAPAPMRRIVGTLSQTVPLLHALGLTRVTA
jgi:circadian clock protein KaiB